MDKDKNIQNELERTKFELGILYEISNAMRTTLNLDEILYIILTSVTAHTGLGFNRAMLFLINEKENTLECKLGIGPESWEEADRIWKRIDQEKMGLDDLIGAYCASKKRSAEEGFNKQARQLKFPLKEEKHLLALGIMDGMPLHLTKAALQNHNDDPIIKMLKSEEMVVTPLQSKEKIIGLILADNFITKKPISKDDIRMLVMLANQAGLAIENSRLYEATVNRAHSDHLTGLWNHGYFQYLLDVEIENARHAKLPLSLTMMDIDDFKIYNDTLGHQAGDRILKKLAELLKNQSRKMDHICRYGGEELAIILPAAEKNEALLIAERIRTDIEKQTFLHEEIMPGKNISVSIGISSFPQDGTTPSELISIADKALYKAKHKGKNNTCCA